MTSQRFNKTIERKKEIIKAAMQLFSEKGYAQTSMRDIARTMGVSLGLCYRYFDSKQNYYFNTNYFHWYSTWNIMCVSNQCY